MAALFAAVFLLSPSPARAFSWSTWWNPRTWFTPATQYTGSVSGRVTVGGLSPNPINVVVVSVDGKPASLTSTGNYSMTVDLGSSVTRSNVPVRFDYTGTPQPTEPSKTYYVSVRANQITPQSHNFATPVVNNVAVVGGTVRNTSNQTVANSKVTVDGTDVYTNSSGVYTRTVPLGTATSKYLSIVFTCAPASPAYWRTEHATPPANDPVDFSLCPVSSSGGGGGGTTQSGSVTGTVQYYTSVTSFIPAVGASVSIIGTNLSATATAQTGGVYTTGTLTLPSSISVTCTYQGKSGTSTATTRSGVNVVNCTIPYLSSGGGSDGTPPPAPAPTEGMFSGCVTVDGVGASGLTVTLSGGPLSGNKTYNVGADPNSGCPSGSYWHTEQFQFPITRNFTITFNPPPGGIAKVQSDVPLTVADKKMNWNFVSNAAKLHIKLLIKGTTIPVPGYSIKISNKAKNPPDIYVAVDGKGEYLYDQGSTGDNVLVDEGNNTDSLYRFDRYNFFGIPADSTLKVELLPRGYCLIVGTVHYLGSVSQPPLSMEVRQNSDVIAYAKQYRSSVITGGRNYDFILKGDQIVAGKSYTVAVKWGAMDPGQQIEAKTISLPPSCSESAPATVDFTTYGQEGMPDPVVSIQTVKKYYLDEPTGVVANTPLEIYEGRGNYNKTPILTINTDSNGLLAISKGQLSDGAYSVYFKESGKYNSSGVGITVDGFSHSYLLEGKLNGEDNCEDHPTGVIQHLIFCGSARDIYPRYPQLWQAWSDKLRWLRQKYPQLASIPEKIEIVNVAQYAYADVTDSRHIIIYFSPAYIQDVMVNTSDAIERVVRVLEHEVGHGLDRVRRSPASGLSSGYPPFIDYFNTAKNWLNQEKAKDFTAFWGRYPILYGIFWSHSSTEVFSSETYAQFFATGLDDKAGLDREIDTIPDEEARAALHKLVDLVITP